MRRLLHYIDVEHQALPDSHYLFRTGKVLVDTRYAGIWYKSLRAFTEDLELRVERLQQTRQSLVESKKGNLTSKPTSNVDETIATAAFQTYQKRLQRVKTAEKRLEDGVGAKATLGYKKSISRKDEMHWQTKGS